MTTQTFADDPLAEVGLLARFLRGAKWYGAEWYITVAGGVLLLLVIGMTIFAPLLAPYSPTALVAEPFLAPGQGRLVLVVPQGTTGIITLADLEGQKVGVLAGRNAYKYARANDVPYRVFPSIRQAIQALQKRRIPALMIRLENLRKASPEQRALVQVVGKPFGPTFWLGTDNLGRDVLSRVILGSRAIMMVALLSALLSAFFGVPVGLLSGFLGGGVDKVLSLVMDSIYSFPGLILAIAMSAMLGPGILNIAVAISVVYIPTYFRVVRGQTLSIKEELYVEAARSLGARGLTILREYIFPNVIASLVVVFSMNVADAILTEAGLSFIGLGLQPPTPDWGYDLSKGKNFLPAGRWWMITFPGLMITLVALAFSLLGEGLNEILNPRLTES